MKILFYDAKNYDKESFQEALTNYPSISIEYFETDLSEKTAIYCKGYDAVCAFVNSILDRKVLQILVQNNVRLVLMRCAGFNNVDIEEAEKLGVTIMTVPAYSPEAVAEHAMALALAANRRIHKAYIKVRENNFSLQGLTGITLYGKTAGIVGTGRIGAAMCRICRAISSLMWQGTASGKNRMLISKNMMSVTLSESKAKCSRQKQEKSPFMRAK